MTLNLIKPMNDATARTTAKWAVVPENEGMTAFDAVIEFLYENEDVPRLELSKEMHKAITKSNPDNIRFCGNLDEKDDLDGKTYRFQVWDLLTTFGVVRVRIAGRRKVLESNSIWTPTNNN